VRERTDANPRARHHRPYWLGALPIT